MKKFLFLLFLLVGIALLSNYCSYKMKISTLIEKDITRRTRKALDEQNMAWVKFAVDGRDITLTGRAPSEAAKMAADKIARVYGYNLLYNLLEVKWVSSASNLKQLHKTDKKMDTAGLIAQEDGLSTPIASSQKEADHTKNHQIEITVKEK